MSSGLRALGVSAICALACGCGSSKSAAPADAGSDAPPLEGGLPGDAGSDTSVSCSVVQTAGGPVQGQPAGAGCSYMGIPFAAPPVGALRWKPPQPAMPWTSPRPSQAASGCPQTMSAFGQPSMDEDCLYLNVWMPPSPPAKAPVMVFVHGGGFNYGSGTFPLYDGTKLAAAANAIVVTINYRLGFLGFLANPALRAEDPNHPSAGNYGIEDQIAAFQWVKANAAAFGGDPANMTIFGESAGGTSMFVHLVSPKSQGLFAHMMIESGWAAYGSGAATRTAADQIGAKLATALGCNDPAMLLSCLRGQSPSAILTATPMLAEAYPAVPNIDGYVLPDDPMKLLASGTFNKVPTLVGTNKNEGTLFVTPPFGNPPTDATTFQAEADVLFPGHGAAIAAQYPASSFGGSYGTTAAEALTDGWFVCPARRVARACATAGVGAFRYEFSHAINFLIQGLGAFHGSELLFVFGNSITGATLQANELPLSQEMMAYWGAMSANGDPNGGGQFAWPKYDTTAEANIVLDLMLSTETALKKTQCDFWDTLNP
jgi:para-nitrobenzyl esterase